MNPITDEKSSDEVALNPNHSHFVFVGDEQDGLGAEIDFRTQFEKALVDTSKMPMFIIVLGGGPGTLKTIINGLRCNYLIA